MSRWQPADAWALWQPSGRVQDVTANPPDGDESDKKPIDGHASEEVVQSSAIDAEEQSSNETDTNIGTDDQHSVAAGSDNFDLTKESLTWKATIVEEKHKQMLKLTEDPAALARASEARFYETFKDLIGRRDG